MATWVAALLLAGCAQGIPGLGTAPTPAAQAQQRQVAYAAVSRAKVYSAPDATSSVQGLLTRHEKVARYQSEAGFAYVEAEGSISGWVRETELVATLPRAATPAATPTPTPTPTPSLAPPEEPEAPPSAEEEDEEAPAPEGEPERSVFDPY